VKQDRHHTHITKYLIKKSSLPKRNTLVLFFTLKMVAEGSSESLVIIYQTIQCKIPKYTSVSYKPA